MQKPQRLKQWSTVFLITLFVAVLTACSDNNDEPKPPQDPPSDSENLYSMKELLSNDFLMGDRILYGVNMYINFTGNNNRELLMDDAWFEKNSKTATGILSTTANSIVTVRLWTFPAILPRLT